MLLPSVRGFLDYAGPNNPLATIVAVVASFSHRNGVGILFHWLFQVRSSGPPIPNGRRGNHTNDTSPANDRTMVIKCRCCAKQSEHRSNIFFVLSCPLYLRFQ